MSDAPETQNKGGRPTDYEPKFCEMLIEHMRGGLSFESFAGKIEVCIKTLFNWEKKHSDFKNAKEIGFAVCQLWWERLGIDNIINTSDSDGYKGGGTSRSLNSSVYIFNMKNRFKWRDKHEDEVDKPTINNNIGSISDEQMAKLLKLARGNK